MCHIFGPKSSLGKLSAKFPKFSQLWMRRIRKLLKVVDDLLYIGELERALDIGVEGDICYRKIFSVRKSVGYRSGRGYMLQKNI
jgi:hypothetical protein